MKLKKIQTLVLFLILLTNISVQGQAPVITNVSVINDQGWVRISWEYSGNDNLIIRRDNLDVTHSLAELTTITDPNVKFFIDETAQANIKPRSYRIDPETIDVSKKVSTMYLTSEYDSCAREINLKWNDLETEYFTANEWIAEKFIIHIEGSDQRDIQVTTSNLPVEYSVPNIIENTDYTIYIETVWEGQDSTSNSNPIQKYTQMPESPDYINALSTSIEGKDTKLKFRVAPDNELDEYKVLKSNTYDGVYDTIETINTDEFVINTIDQNSKPASEISYYKLVSINGCGNETTNSDIINNIVLQVENEKFINTLNWNLFKEKSYISVVYDLYRISGNEDPELIRSLTNQNTISDDIEDLQGEKLSGQFCYFIKAKEESFFNTDYSTSNIVCVYLEPKIYIPEAFTPNTNNDNSIFKPVFSFTPNNFEMIIYNRWGNIIYKTQDFEKGWNGKQNNGNFTPTGTYIYYINIKTPDNKIIKKRGNVTVFYP